MKRPPRALYWHFALRSLRGTWGALGPMFRIRMGRYFVFRDTPLQVVRYVAKHRPENSRETWDPLVIMMIHQARLEITARTRRRDFEPR